MTRVTTLKGFNDSATGKYVSRGASIEVTPERHKELARSGLVPAPKSGGEELRADGPTVAEFVAAGYQADHYPPAGYASRSTDDEIAEAQRAQHAQRQQGGAKEAAPPDNKAITAAAITNKAATAPKSKAKRGAATASPATEKEAGK